MASFNDRGEIDVGGNVLQTRKKERIGVCVVPVMAHQSARVTLWVVVLVAGKPVVE